MKSQDEIEYEERIKRRVLILLKLIQEGSIKFAESTRADFEESFSKVRFTENGELDVSTIDGIVRSMALAAEDFDHKTKMKDAISLFEIQQRYFSMIGSNFNQFYEGMIEKKMTPHQAANNIAYGNYDVSFLVEAVEPIIKDVNEFWEVVSESGYLHLEDDYSSVKAVFGGDLFPNSTENIASKCGIYIDTIVLPCPFIRSRSLFTIWTREEKVYYLLKFALSVLQYRELALAELEKPIVVILPDKEMMDEFAFKRIQELGERDTLYHAKKVFDRGFTSIEELISFGKELDTVEKVMKEIKDPKKVLFDTDFKEPLNIQIEKQMKGLYRSPMKTENPGLIVSMLGSGRMSVCNELLMKSHKVNGVPLIDAPTSWEYFKWKLEYDTERAFSEKDFSKLHIVKGLNGLADTKLNWVGKIPPVALIELRKNGAMDEIRAILSKGIDELVKCNDLDFTMTSNKVFENLKDAIENHQKNIEQLKNKKWKIAGKDFGSWIVMGSVEIAAACTGTLPYGLAALALDQILDAPKLKDLPKTIDKLKDIGTEQKNLRKTPIGLMFNYK